VNATQLPRRGKSVWADLEARCEEIARLVLLAMLRQARKTGRRAVNVARRPLQKKLAL
jgi:hypothetical protein